MADRPFPTELVRSSTDLVLLALLTHRAMYGYEILVTLEERGNGGFRFKQGTLYPLLYRLEREGWIRGHEQEPATGKRRKVYRVTAAGRSELGRRVEDWRRHTAAVEAILDECLGA
ncbi:MAG: helix-turn-helix transcriptional regulator [Planctomycetota bacterium]